MVPQRLRNLVLCITSKEGAHVGLNCVSISSCGGYRIMGVRKVDDIHEILTTGVVI